MGVVSIFAEVKAEPLSGRRLNQPELDKVSKTIVRETNDPESQLYKSLIEQYRLSKAEAVRQPLQFSFWSLDGQATQCIIDACNQGQLAELIHKCIDIEGVSKAWWVDLQFDISSLDSLPGGDSGQDVNYIPSLGAAVNQNSQTPLHVAVSRGQSSLISYLVTDCRLNPTLKDQGGKTPLQVTAENGDIKSLDELVCSGVSLERDLNVTAAHFGRDKYLQYLLDNHGLDPYQKESNSGRNCLMAAVEFGHITIVKYLLKRFSFKIDEVSTQKRSVFHFAADNGHTEVAEVLLEYAKEKGHDIVKLLSQRDQHKIDRLCSMVPGIDKGKAAWHYVHLKRRCVHIFQKNTKRGRVDASKMGTIVQSGWGEGADADQLKESLQRYMSQSQTRDGQPDLSPLALAISRGQTEVAKLYIAAGASVETRDCFGQTLMHLSAMRGMLEVAPLLRDIAAVKDDDGLTPLQIAELNEQGGMIDFFRLQMRDESCSAMAQVSPLLWHSHQLSRQHLYSVLPFGNYRYASIACHTIHY